jgi:hypothetical protein
MAGRSIRPVLTALLRRQPPFTTRARELAHKSDVDRLYAEIKRESIAQ